MISASILGQVEVPQIEAPSGEEVRGQALTVAPTNAKAAVAAYDTLTPNQKQDLQKAGKELIDALGNTDLFQGISLKLGIGGFGPGGLEGSKLGSFIGKIQGIAANLGKLKALYEGYQQVKEVEDAIDDVDTQAAEFDAGVVEAEKELDVSEGRVYLSAEGARRQIVTAQEATQSRIANFAGRSDAMNRIAPKLAVGGAVAAVAAAGLVALGLSDVDIGDVLGG